MTSAKRGTVDGHYSDEPIGFPSEFSPPKYCLTDYLCRLVGFWVTIRFPHEELGLPEVQIELNEKDVALRTV